MIINAFLTQVFWSSVKTLSHVISL